MKKLGHRFAMIGLSFMALSLLLLPFTDAGIYFFSFGGFLIAVGFIKDFWL